MSTTPNNRTTRLPSHISQPTARQHTYRDVFTLSQHKRNVFFFPFHTYNKRAATSVPTVSRLTLIGAMNAADAPFTIGGVVTVPLELEAGTITVDEEAAAVLAGVVAVGAAVDDGVDTGAAVEDGITAAEVGVAVEAGVTIAEVAAAVDDGVTAADVGAAVDEVTTVAAEDDTTADEEAATTEPVEEEAVVLVEAGPAAEEEEPLAAMTAEDEETAAPAEDDPPPPGAPTGRPGKAVTVPHTADDCTVIQ